MRSRRSPYEIYWEILAFCRTPRSFTAIINRCDLNSKTGQEYVDFLVAKGYLAPAAGGGRTLYAATERAGEYTALFAQLYRSLFDTAPGFKL
jgi:predicted transcriptional regulator